MALGENEFDSPAVDGLVLIWLFDKIRVILEEK